MLDIVMWTKNAGCYFPKVLKRIDEVIPNIHRKILVDDHSIDDTIRIAERYGWEIYPNPKTGISSGFREALRHVDCEFFISIEQDMVLAKDWWDRISPYIADPRVACVQGIRCSVNPILRAMDEYSYRKRSGDLMSISSLDNNIWRSCAVKDIGIHGDYVVCDEGFLLKELSERGYRWIVDETVVSQHLKTSIRNHLKHVYFYTKITCGKDEKSKVGVRQKGFWYAVKLLAISPYSSLKMALKTRCPKLALVYPTIVFFGFKALLEDRLSNV